MVRDPKEISGGWRRANPGYGNDNTLDEMSGRAAAGDQERDAHAVRQGVFADQCTRVLRWWPMYQGQRRMAKKPFQKVRCRYPMVKSHAENQRNPAEVWFSILILDGVAVLVESDGSAMVVLRGYCPGGQIGMDGRWLTVRWVTAAGESIWGDCASRIESIR